MGYIYGRGINGSIGECASSYVVGCSEHFLIRMELGRVTQRGRKVKRVLRRWYLERFDDIKVRATYQKALQAEVLGSTDSI